MGTFLKVVGIIIIVITIIGLILSIISTQVGLLNITELFKNINPEISSSLGPVVSAIQIIWIIISAIFSFFIIVFGVSLYVLGSIYNDVRNIRERFKSIEIVKE